MSQITVTHPNRDLRRHTYREFRERIGRLASGLTQIGVDQGDVVAILEWDSDRYHECYFAIPMMGAVMQTVNVSLVPEDIAYTIIDSGATTVLFNADFRPLIEKLALHLKAVKNYVLMHDRPESPPTSFAIKAEYEALLSIGSPYFPFPDFDENACATIFDTTGTTGRPKGVYFTHQQIVLHVLAGIVEYGLTPRHGRFHRDDVYMPMTPMFHVHAWGCPYVATLGGAKLVFAGRYTPEDDRHGKGDVHALRADPAADAALRDGNRPGRFEPPQDGGWGSALPLARAALARGIDVFAGYGMSESGPTLTAAHLKSKHEGSPEKELPHRILAGIAVPLVDLRVVDENMAEVPHDGEAVATAVHPGGIQTELSRYMTADVRKQLNDRLVRINAAMPRQVFRRSPTRAFRRAPPPPSGPESWPPPTRWAAATARTVTSQSWSKAPRSWAASAPTQSIPIHAKALWTKSNEMVGEQF
jgi:fatty-acyl-CoA synthase